MMKLYSKSSQTRDSVMFVLISSTPTYHLTYVSNFATVAIITLKIIYYKLYSSRSSKTYVIDFIVYLFTFILKKKQFANISHLTLCI